MARFRCPICFQPYTIETADQEASLRTHLFRHVEKSKGALDADWVDEQMASLD